MNWPRPLPSSRQRARCLIRAASWLVPAASRESWQREWLAELHYAERAVHERGGKDRLVDFAFGAFSDAAWHRARDWNREDWERAASRSAQSAGFCLAALAAILVAIVALSGLLPKTRSVFLPLPYADASRVATVTQGGATLAVRSGIHKQWVGWWRADSHLIEDAASYSWSEQNVDGKPALRAKVGPGFFPLLRARSSTGSPISSGPLRNCRDCVLLAYDYWRHAYGGKIPAGISIDGRPYKVAGVLEKQFWFLNHRIAVWEIAGDAENPAVRTGVVVRLRPDVSSSQAEAEMASILQAHGINAWSSLVSISMLTGRVRSVLGSFGLALLLAIGTILPVVRPTFTAWSDRAGVRVAFFCAKTAMAVLAVLLAGLEFTRAPSITMLGGTDLATEPFSTWLFLLGCMGAISWSIFDQRRRCRVCLRRFGLAAQIGCPGCVLLSWSGTEMVCLDGHGTLHVPEMASSWQERDKWTSVDDSLVELFAKGR